MSEPVQSILPTPITTPHAPPTFITQPENRPLSMPMPMPVHVQVPPASLQPLPLQVSMPSPDSIGQRTTEGPEQAMTGSDKTKRKRKSSSRTEPETVQKTKRSRRTATPGRRSRAPSLPPYDPNADPGDEIDPTVVTMASLCDDTGQGRVSAKAMEILSNHTTWKARNKEKRARMRTLMELKKYGREQEAEGESQGVASKDSETSVPQEEQNTAVALAGATNGADKEGDFDYTQGLNAGRFNVQVRIGPNGETIVDEESLVVDRSEVENTQDYTHIVESDMTKFVNSASYSKRFRGSRWSAEETERFFDALSQHGENYELIAYILPGRDRKSCKNKFKVEDRKNPARINYCLNNRVPVDMQTLSRMTGRDFSGPVPEIRAPPRPEVRIEETGIIETESSRGEASAQKVVRKRRGRNVQPEDGVVIVGQVEFDS